MLKDNWQTRKKNIRNTWDKVLSNWEHKDNQLNRRIIKDVKTHNSQKKKKALKTNNIWKGG